jgi:hypothetical protein
MIKNFLFSIFYIFCLNGVLAQDQIYKRIQIEYTLQNLQLISKSGLEADFIKDDRFVILEIPDYELEKLSAAGIRYEILIDDVANFYAERNRGKNPKEITEQFRAMKNYEVPEGFSLGSMGGFCTYDELMAHLDNMAASYPDLITIKQTIGSQLTIEGRPIYWIKISDNPGVNEEEPEILYTGLTHAREPGSMQVLLFYMYYLLENYATNPEIKSLVDNTEMYFVPCVNPDGYIRNQTTNPNGGGQWRKNLRNNGDGSFGVDLNRNFGFMWGYDDIGSSPTPSNLIYRGAAPFSEVETQLIRDFCNEHNFKIALNYHTYGNYLLHSWGYTASSLTTDHTYFTAIGQELADENNYRVGTPGTMLYRVNGESSDWMYGEQTSKPRIFSFTPEVGTEVDGFWPPMERIIPQCFEVLHQNITAAKLAGSYFLLHDLTTFNISNSQGFLSFKTERRGLANTPLTISIQGIGDHFTNIGGAKNYNNIQQLQKITDSISFTLKPGIMAGEQIKYIIKAVSGSFLRTDTIIKTFGNSELQLYDDCSTMNNWESAKWHFSNTAYVSPQYSMTDSPGSSYLNNENSLITLKTEINLKWAVSAWLSFNAMWTLDGASDYVICEISADSGQNWNILSGKYTSIPKVNTLPAVPMFMGKQTDWVKETMDLTDFCGNQIIIRFTIITDAGTRKDGFYFDNLKIEKIDGNIQHQDFNYSSGWNSLSSYLIPENTSFNMIFANNQNEVFLIQDAEGNFYQPGNPTNTLSQWESQTGYMIKLTENTIFSINGAPVSFAHLDLTAGWNQIPVLSHSPVLISEIIVSPSNSIEIIKEIAGLRLWWPERNIISLDSLIPGKSYLIKLKNDATIEFPINQ